MTPRCDTERSWRSASRPRGTSPASTRCTRRSSRKPPSPSRRCAPSPDVLAQRVAGTMPRYPWLVAGGAQVLGYAYGHQFAERDAFTCGRWRPASTCAETARGQRVGSTLYRRALHPARGAGIPAGVRRDHPAQPRERRTPRSPRLRARRDLPRRRLQVRALARRRLVAAPAHRRQRRTAAHPSRSTSSTPPSSNARWRGSDAGDLSRTCRPRPSVSCSPHSTTRPTTSRRHSRARSGPDLAAREPARRLEPRPRHRPPHERGRRPASA